MVILDVTEFFSPRGGVRRYLESRARGLSQAGHRHVVVAPGQRNEQGPGAGLETLSTVITVQGPALPYDHDYHLFWRLGRIRRLIAEQAPDVVELHSVYLAALAWLGSARSQRRIFSVFWHSDFIDAYIVPACRRVVGQRLAAWLVEPLWAWVRWVGHHAAVVFVASADQEMKLRSHGLNNVQRLPFGFDRAVFSPQRRDLAWRRRILGADHGQVVVAVGRLAAEKRFDVLLDGFFLLRKQRPERHVILVIFGDGPERAALERQAAGRSDVIFCGFEPDQTRLARGLASADVFAHAGAHETFCMSLAQALLCGIPAVVPAAGAAAELIDDTCGATYRPHDPAALADAVASILDGDRNRWQTAVLARAAALPDAQAQTEATLAVYHRLLARPETTPKCAA